MSTGESVGNGTGSGSGMEVETILTKAVKKLFKWQLSGLTGTLIVASILWLVVFFLFFLILVFVMCVEFHYERRERQDAELGIPKDDEKLWAEKRPESGSRQGSGSSLKKVAPIPMPPLPDEKEDAKVSLVSDVELPEESVAPEEAETRQVSPVAEESVIVDAPEQNEEAAVAISPPPDDADGENEGGEAEEEPAAEADQPPEEDDTQKEEAAAEENPDTQENLEEGGDNPDPDAEGDPEPAAEDAKDDAENNNDEGAEEEEAPEENNESADTVEASAPEDAGGDNDKVEDSTEEPAQEKDSESLPNHVGSPSKSSSKGED